jgi:CRISPR-associated protein Cas5t
MECLRVKLYTPTGIFKNPLSIKGIEVYPLPPYSTIIGLIYRAMGRKWNGEYFQISIQGDYQAIYRDYVWFKKYDFDKKKLDKLPLQVPILYNLRLLIHIKASEELLKEIENGLKEPRELLFLSGGEYPVKVEEVKRVKCLEKFFSEEDNITLSYHAYIPKEFKERISFSGTGEGILYSLSYFYKNSQKPKTYSWIDAYYFPKGTEIYGSLILDEDNHPVFLAQPEVAELRRVEEEYVRFYVGNWLMASACVGVLKVLENAGEDIKKYVEERTLKIPKSLWEKLPELYLDYLLKDKESVKRSLEDSYKQKGNEINPYNTLIYSRLRDFHSNSPFTNQSHEYIKRLKGVYSENLEEVLEKVKESFLEAYRKLLTTTKDLSSICFFCHERQAKNYVDATTFTPLFASLETVRNFIWDPIPICKECEFLLYFASAGFYRSAGKYLFVYIPDDLLETYRLNLILSTKEEVEQEKLGKVLSVVKYVLHLEKQKSIWILQNIYFVEIEMVGDATANIYSFHINQNLASAIRKLIDNYPKNLQDIFSEFLFYIYTGRSLYEFLFLLLSGFFRKESYKNLDANTIDAKIVRAGRNMQFLSSNLLFFINFQEVLNMNEQRDYINKAFRAGRELKKLYSENERTQKKLEPLTYRLLEAVRRKDKEYFIHNLIRAYLEVEKEIPYFFKEALDDKNFSMIAYAFLIGLNSEERSKAEEAPDKATEETTNEGEITESA